MAPSSLAVRDHAFFLDVDGTLAPIATTPQEAGIPASTLQILQRLVKAADGAVAIVSGRPLEEIDQLVAPLRLPAAALHGAHWRDPDGATGRLAVDADEVADMAQQLAPLLSRHSGLMLEQKGIALALHYRHAPHCGELVRAAMEKLIQRRDGFVLQPGKMVFEIKPRAASKAHAIERFLGLAPFEGRVPVFAGDDLTDEAGFAAVNERGGLSVKIGPGPSSARRRLPDPAALARWLASLA
ncbi:trehalose-phosphatase [Pigmentiphaga soli]